MGFLQGDFLINLPGIQGAVPPPFEIGDIASVGDAQGNLIATGQKIGPLKLVQIFTAADLSVSIIANTIYQIMNAITVTDSIQLPAGASTDFVVFTSYNNPEAILSFSGVGELFNAGAGSLVLTDIKIASTTGLNTLFTTLGNPGLFLENVTLTGFGITLLSIQNMADLRLINVDMVLDDSVMAFLNVDNLEVVNCTFTPNLTGAAKPFLRIRNPLVTTQARIHGCTFNIPATYFGVEVVNDATADSRYRLTDIFWNGDLNSLLDPVGLTAENDTRVISNLNTNNQASFGMGGWFVNDNSDAVPCVNTQWNPVVFSSAVPAPTGIGQKFSFLGGMTPFLRHDGFCPIVALCTVQVTLKTTLADADIKLRVTKSSDNGVSYNPLGAGIEFIQRVTTDANETKMLAFTIPTTGELFDRFRLECRSDPDATSVIFKNVLMTLTVL